MIRVQNHVHKILTSDAPLLLRREQLNSDFRKGIPDLDEEDGKLELVDDGERHSDVAEDHEAIQAEGSQGKVPLAKGKAKAKGKASPKGKAKAKASPKGKAKAKASPKGKAKAKAKARAEPKQKAAPKPDAKEPKSKPKRGAQAQAEGPSQPEKKVRKSKGEAGTFAGRYTPKSELQRNRHNAIRCVFENCIADKLNKQSAFQAEREQKKRSHQFQHWHIAMLSRKSVERIF